MAEKKPSDQSKRDADRKGGGDKATARERPDGSWADEAAKARTADDPRARTPGDAAGQPSTRPFDE